MLALLQHFKISKLYLHFVPPKIHLSEGEKDFREKAPIYLNDVLKFYRQRISDLKHKGKLVILQVQTAHFGIIVNPKQLGA